MLGILWNSCSFILVIGVLVLVHEFGHFIVAKWCGVRIRDHLLRPHRGRGRPGHSLRAFWARTALFSWPLLFGCGDQLPSGPSDIYLWPTEGPDNKVTDIEVTGNFYVAKIGTDYSRDPPISIAKVCRSREMPGQSSWLALAEVSPSPGRFHPGPTGLWRTSAMARTKRDMPR